MATTTSAGDYLEVRIYTVAAAYQQRGLKYVATLLVGHFTVMPYGAQLDQIVIKRKESGQEALRIESERDKTAALVARIEQDLTAMTVDDFLAAWSAYAL